MLSEVNISQPKIAVFSDLHLGIHQDSASWHTTALQWCDWIVSDLKKNKIKDIFFLGDFFHYRSDVSVSTLHVAAQILKKLEDFNMVFIVGNHDSWFKQRADVNSLSIFSGWHNITVIDKTTTTKLYGKDIVFVPWGADINTIPKSDILFGHLEIAGFKMNSFKTCEHGIDAAELLVPRANLVMTGHFHLRDERKYNEGAIVYVGNPFEMDFGDASSSKGYYILDIEQATYKFTENITSPKHKKILLSDLTGLTALSGQDIKSIIGSNIVKLIIDTKVNESCVDELIKRLCVHTPFSFSADYSLIDNSITIDNQNYDATQSVDMQKTIEDFVSVLDIENKEEIAEICIDIFKRANEK